MGSSDVEAAAAVAVITSERGSTKQNGDNNNNDNSSSSSSSIVEVTVNTILPNVSPSAVQLAWLDYTWRRGGGLLAIFVPIFDDTTENDNGDNDNDYDNHNHNESSFPRKRLLLPLFAEEEIITATIGS